jgi:membrane-bound lytic murein transglycosylase D
LAPGSSEKIAVNKPTHQPRGNTSTRQKRSKSKAPANSAQLSYKVKKGDTIGHIAEWYDVRAWQIRSWNGTSNYIRPGENLTIYVPKSKQSYYSQINSMSFSKKQKLEREQRSGKDITEAYLASADDGEGVTYTVQSNDTLIYIANSFGVSVNQIKRLNNLNGSRIFVGQQLKIK